MEPEREAKLAQLERILQSRALEGSENLKSFLRYVVLKSVDEPEDAVKEYTIATEVFGRTDRFSPRSDSVVRVQAKRLRAKLENYYATEGKADRILIDLPKGHYNPVFSYLAESEDSGPLAEKETDITRQMASLPGKEISAEPTKDRKWIIALASVIVLLAILSTLLAVSNRSLRQQIREFPSQTPPEDFGLVWEPFLKDSDQTLLILSNPTVYRFINPMDSDVLLQKSIALSPENIKHLNEAVGDKFMIQHSLGRLILCTDEYTGMGEAIGLARITDTFRKAGRSPLLKQSRTVSPEDLKNHNVILLGSVWVNEWSGKLPIKEDFSYTSDATIVNNNPLPGEEHEYRPKFDGSGKLIEDYGLIAIKPNIFYKNTVMILAGIHSEGTEAAAEYITSADYLKNINERLRQIADSSGPPKYYQALLRVAVDNGIPTTISLLTVHELRFKEE